MRKTRSLGKNLLLLFIAIVISLAIGEIILRVFSYDPYLTDEKYGFRHDHPITFHRTVEDNPGVFRTVTVEMFENGFKRWGDVNTSKKKVLIVGDSFTEMRLTNNGEEWFAYMENAFPNTEFFVYGAGGFGTLQEYFVIDDYIDIIKPDIIIVQMHYNDYVNNDFETDLREYPMSNMVSRPFLENGTIVMRLPLKFAAIRKYSRLGGYVLMLYDNLYKMYILRHKDNYFNKKYGPECWSDYENCKVFGGRFNETLNTTEQIFMMMRARAGDTPIYLFNVDTRVKWAEEEIADKANLTYIPGVSDFVYRHHNLGVNTQILNDGHWNLVGNRLAGEYLVKYFKDKGILS